MNYIYLIYQCVACERVNSKDLEIHNRWEGRRRKSIEIWFGNNNPLHVAGNKYVVTNLDGFFLSCESVGYYMLLH